ncbi:hypothetical protein BH20ACT2_BH20ACT2_01350 [soil metagenome]
MTRMVRGRCSDDRGAVAINLVVVLGFALYAVIQLTRTTIAAEQIDDRVVSITASVEPIDESLTNVPKLDDTNATAKQILAAATPLSAHLDGVIESAGSIDSTVDLILGNANTINGTVGSINGVVNSISGTVNSIDGNISGVLGQVRLIEPGVAAINGRVDAIINLARPIGGDLANVLAEVGGPRGAGLGSGGDRTIVGHANGIDCAALGRTCVR